jgi:hypothetical protein
MGVLEVVGLKKMARYGSAGGNGAEEDDSA